MNPAPRSAERHEMVKRQIMARGVCDRLVLSALSTVPRESFVPKHFREFAYEDRALPIAAEQTISQPYIVAFMIESLSLKGGERVLEIGTGSGYAAAILAEIAGEVFTVERIPELAAQSESTLKVLDYGNVQVRCGDGTEGWPEHAPYDAILVSAGGPCVPKSLKSQLKVGGRLVIPVGNAESHQKLVRITRLSESRFQEEDIAEVRFVPLVGKEGWAEGEGRLGQTDWRSRLW